MKLASVCRTAVILATLFLGHAQAALVSGTYSLSATYNDPLITSNSLVLDAVYDTTTNAFTKFDVTSFLIDGVEMADKGEFLIEDLSGNGRFRATFRQLPRNGNDRLTWEIFYRFVFNFTNEAFVTSNIVGIYSQSGQSNISRSGFSATFEERSFDTNRVPEPAALALVGLAAAGMRLGRRRRC